MTAVATVAASLLLLGLMGGLQSLSAGGGGSRHEAPRPDQLLSTLRRAGQVASPQLKARTSVLVWNVQKEQNKEFAGTFGRLVQGRDLLLLQEVHLKPGVEELLLADRAHVYTFGASFVYTADGSPSGVAIGSLADAHEPVAQLTEDREPIVGTPKCSLLAKYRLPGDDQYLLVATVHGINRASEAAFERQMDHLTEQLALHKGPIIFAGDFNTQSAKKTEYVMAAAAKLGLSAVGFNPDTRTLSKLSRRPLDHAFVRGMRVENAQSWGDAGGSDHVALTFDVVV